MFTFRKAQPANANPEETLARLKALVQGGARPPIDSLSRDEMVAAGQLINQGIASIGSAACRPILQAKLS